MKGGPIAAVALDDGVGGAAVEELLVGVEQALFVHQVLVVAVVQRARRDEVERGEIAVAVARLRGAVALPGVGEGRIDVGLVVDPVAECDAPSLANRVRS